MLPGAGQELRGLAVAGPQSGGVGQVGASSQLVSIFQLLSSPFASIAQPLPSFFIYSVFVSLFVIASIFSFFFFFFVLKHAVFVTVG